MQRELCLLALKLPPTVPKKGRTTKHKARSPPASHSAGAMVSHDA